MEYFDSSYIKYYYVQGWTEKKRKEEGRKEGEGEGEGEGRKE